MNSKYILEHLRNFPNYPKDGIQFKDVTFLFTDRKVIKEIVDELYNQYKDKGITKIVGLETRGVIMASILAYKLGAGLVLCRKKGKMPGLTHTAKYKKEYGYDEIELQDGAITKDDVVLIHDDLLATGGSMKATYDLVNSFGPKSILINFIFELKSECPEGRKHMPNEVDIESLIEL